jgi:alkanesulfonate monooxygenase SsuD/methylene tetrahydromethanopterin reductase-like flavin-dependent oxidoreductase (luciferase family)
MKVGVFDHLDRAGPPLAEQYEDRLRLIAAYETAGVHAYHLAEHHSTPLGMAPSPNLFLSAVAQRTRRLRFGPLVYPLVLYHPLRLIEEICMLDHMSGGRLEFGIGKGASPHELQIYGADPTEWAPAAHQEALLVLMQGLTNDRLEFEGQIFKFKDTPIELRPLQQPHPPMWYGASRPEGAAFAAQNGFNIVANAPADRARPIYDSFREAWSDINDQGADFPLMGMNRFVVIADTDQGAAEIAGRAYQRWNRSFWQLWDARGPRPYAYYPDTFQEAEAAGFGVAGTVHKVLDTLQDQLGRSGANYLVCRFAFGDLTLSESMRSLELFAGKVMPFLGASQAAAQ